MFTFQIDQCYYVLPLTNTSLPSAARTNIVLPQFTGCKYVCITSQSEQLGSYPPHMEQETLKALSVVGSLFFFSCCVNFSHSPKVLDVISYHCNFDFSQGHFHNLFRHYFPFLHEVTLYHISLNRLFILTFVLRSTFAQAVVCASTHNFLAQKRFQFPLCLLPVPYACAALCDSLHCRPL